MDDEYDDQCFEHEDDECNESIGSCDECECDLYEDDTYYRGGFQYCGQCYWAICGGR